MDYLNYLLKLFVTNLETGKEEILLYVVSKEVAYSHRACFEYCLNFENENEDYCVYAYCTYSSEFKNILDKELLYFEK